jgi:hypothetical protein
MKRLLFGGNISAYTYGCSQVLFANLQPLHSVRKKMSWIPSALVTGMQNLFNGFDNGQVSRAEMALEDIREAMLDGLGVTGAVAASRLELRVTHANDLQDLWYLRGDIMAAIASVHGEVMARQKLNQISSMFRGLLPRSLTSRPSSLGN